MSKRALKQQFKMKTSSRGLGLPAAIFVITVLALVVLALARLDESSGLGFTHDINSTRAFMAAESGAQIALNLKFPPSGGAGASCTSASSTIYTINFSSISPTPPGLNNCTVSVTCISDTVSGSNYYTFNSVASCGVGLNLATRKIEVRAKQ